MRGLLGFLQTVERVSDTLERLRSQRNGRASWVVPVAAVLVSGWMFHVAQARFSTPAVERGAPATRVTRLNDIGGGAAAALGPQWECIFDSSGIGNDVVLCDGAYQNAANLNDSVQGEPQLSVVDQSLGFPARMLRTAIYEAADPNVRTNSTTDTMAIPMPAIGEAVFWQVYFRQERAEVGDSYGVMHWWHHGGTTAMNGIFSYVNNYQNGDSLDFRFQKNVPAWSPTIWYNCFGCLQMDHTYRLQFKYTRVDTLRLSIHMQIWDSTGAVARTQADLGFPFVDADSNEVIVRDTSDIRWLISWTQLGSNDSVSPGGVPNVKWLYVCCEAKKTDPDTSAWIGTAPYN